MIFVVSRASELQRVERGAIKVMAGLTHDKYSITFAAVTITFVCNLMGRPTHRFHSLCDVAQVAIALDSAHGRSGTAGMEGGPQIKASTSFDTISPRIFGEWVDLSG